MNKEKMVLFALIVSLGANIGVLGSILTSKQDVRYYTGNPIYTVQAKVNRVIDGDTVVVDIYLPFSITLENERVRLLGYDAYEVKGKDKELGLLAKSTVEKLINNKRVMLVTYGERDSFGRVLASVLFKKDNKWVSLGDYLHEIGLTKK